MLSQVCLSFVYFENKVINMKNKLTVSAVIRIILLVLGIASLLCALIISQSGADIPYDDVGALHHAEAGLRSLLLCFVGAAAISVSAIWTLIKLILKLCRK